MFQKLKISVTNGPAIKMKYRDSPVSAVFWSPGNRTIWKTALIRDWFSTKIPILDFWIFKVPFFSSFWPNFNNKMILLGLFWQLFYSSIMNFNLLTRIYATFSLDYYWNSDLMFTIQQILEKTWRKVVKKMEFDLKFVMFWRKTALNRGIALFSAVCKSH